MLELVIRKRLGWEGKRISRDANGQGLGVLLIENRLPEIADYRGPHVVGQGVTG